MVLDTEETGNRSGGLRILHVSAEAKTLSLSPGEE